MSMRIRYSIPVYKICWLNHAKGGIIGTFYEPETKDELLELCRGLYKDKKPFDIIGYTSNIYFLPSYNVEIMVSTRLVKELIIEDDYLIVDCGVGVRTLARQMVNEGIKGFEGLIDLPGTVAASVYGNASCYDCSINSLLLSIELLMPNGEVVVMMPEDLKLSKRSSALKRGELEGVVLSAKLRKLHGDVNELMQLAEQNHQKRQATQPGPKDNLGSIYSVSGQLSIYGQFLHVLVFFYGCMLMITGRNKQSVRLKKKDLLFRLLGARKMQSYVYDWNRYIWKDEQAHEFFWTFHSIHKKMYKRSDFEIEIKG